MGCAPEHPWAHGVDATDLWLARSNQPLAGLNENVNENGNEGDLAQAAPWDDHGVAAPGIPWGTPGYPGVPLGTPGYPGVPLGTPGYLWVPKPKENCMLPSTTDGKSRLL